MTDADNWIDVGAAQDLSQAPLRRLTAKNAAVALSFADGKFGAVSDVCNHVGGPLGDGHLDGDYVKCPWHGWKFHRCTGTGEPGFENDRVPSFPVKVENGRVLINVAAATKRSKQPHDPHPLSREVERADGPLRLAGISTTAMDPGNPRFSGSDHMLAHALAAAGREGAQTRLQLFAQAGGSIPTPFLVILVFWLIAIFVSFTLFAEIQFDRHGLPIRLRAVVCGCDLPGLGTGQPLRGADGDFKCDAAERAFALKFCRYWFQLAVIGATAPIHLAGASRGLTAMIKNRFYSWGSKALDGAITASKCCATAGFSAAPRSSISPASTVVPAEGGRVR